MSLAVMELILFTAVSVVLSYRVVFKAMLITHKCFGSHRAALAQHPGFLFLTLGWARGWNGTQPRQVIWVVPKGYSTHITLCSALKTEEGFSRGQGYWSQTGWTSVCFWKPVSDRLCITCIGYCFFNFPSVKLLLLQHMILFTFSLLIFSPSLCKSNWMSICVHSSAD